jgi:Zn-dependent protease with chaperone function
VDNVYSAGPSTVPADLVKPSGVYLWHAWLAMASLLVFIVLYCLLAGWFTWTAYRTIAEVIVRQNLGYIFVATGATFLAVFMLKGLFFIKRGRSPNAIEITAGEQPRLFEYLHRLADEAGAPRPARVFLSARVNAAVFYDLSLLSLVFPSRKNLEIGLALVNVLTLSEIKAVLAHEFGHFAQRSMAIGSWVYIAHQIAEQIVVKRDFLDRALQSLSREDPRIAWVGWLMSLIVWSLRSLMDTLLRIVLLAERALSRQMEFQADLVAVSLTGSDELVHALHKLQAADDAWGRTLDFTDSEIREGRIPHDLFAVQTRIIEKTAQVLNDDNYGKIPAKTSSNPAQHRVFKTTFAQPPQMWSTHPASADREENAKRHYLHAPHDARSAWLLFDDVDTVKQSITHYLIGDADATTASSEDTYESVDARYHLLQYHPRYQGVYLNRSVVRYAAQATQLYRETLQQPDVLQAMDALYGKEIAQALVRLRELIQERQSLEALRNKTYQATGGIIMFRGKRIARRQLPSVIREVFQEEELVRSRILEHDCQCRSAHLAAADQLGSGWREYLLGLIEVLHYSEHALANLRDANGLLNNVVAIVLADGKVSKRERKQVIAAANTLYDVLAGIYQQKAELIFDDSLAEYLGVSTGSDLLQELTLNPPGQENLDDWMHVIDSWVAFTTKRLFAVCDAALENLLVSESYVERIVRETGEPKLAPAKSQVPASYPTLRPGEERKRQTRLGWWDRFQTSDGFFPGLLRVSIALVLVGGVFLLGRVVATDAFFTIYNSLDRPVIVVAGNQQYDIPPNSVKNYLQFPVDAALTIETQTTSGELIERFTPELTGFVEHYVYNVAGASPLVEWTAVYGNAEKRPPRFFDAPRWTRASVDDYFTTPPTSVRTKGGGASRRVLEGLSGHSITEVMNMLQTDEARKQVILAHAKWDTPNTPNSEQWKELASRVQSPQP